MTQIFTNEMLSKAKEVINNLNESFDSHEFIQKFIAMYEKEYVELLYGYKDKTNIFQSFHSQIGFSLGNLCENLGIEKDGRGLSSNIKGNESDNQKWRKIK